MNLTNNFQYLHRKNSHNPGEFKDSKVLLRVNAKVLWEINDPTTLSILLQDFDKHLSKRGYSDTESQALSEQIKLRS